MEIWGDGDFNELFVVQLNHVSGTDGVPERKVRIGVGFAGVAAEGRSFIPSDVHFVLIP